MSCDGPFRLERLGSESPRVYFEQLARIHRAEIDQGFLSTLGIRFLSRLYRALAASPDAFVIAATRDGEIVGFICGSTDTGRVYRRFVLRSGLLSVPALLPKIVTLRRLRRLLETLVYPARRQNREYPTPAILNFCVAGPWQRKGVGRTLFAALVEEFHARGVDAIKIVTGLTQQKAQKFYESLGIFPAGQIAVHGDTPSVVYVYAIPSASKAGLHAESAPC